ncbi:SDR family NAD(P)-dependent oxidoreductase [Actinoplanes subglobosus]|uniref:SDR family NAD(P)-dependent oxidoreductase n=1 Tax=Actinoplanes subglobosus TaxID=1547892 RepID=A0ABV8IM76_9ACTN
MSSGRLAGKVALISGTAQGQGRAAAQGFAAEGAIVVGGDINAEGSAETARLVTGAGHAMISPLPLDVTDEASVTAWVEAAVTAFGRVDIVYANAGAVRFGPVDQQSYADWAFTVRAELDSVFLTVRAAWPHLKASRGCVLTVGSTAGLTGSVTNQRTAHSATKGGVIALTRQLAAEGAPHGIRANCISPGMIETEGTRQDLLAPDHPMRTIARAIPLGRVGTPADVIPAAVFLAGDEAAYITGANLVVDGGWSMVLPG